MPPDRSAQPPGDADPSRAEVRLRVVEVLSAAARGADTHQAPEALCRACVGLLPVTGASVSISGSAPAVRATWCASDRIAAQLAEAQYTLGDGPCQTALSEATPVLAADLAEGPDSRRWPVFAHQAVELGVRAVFSLPLGVGGPPIGTLDLYRDRPGGLSGSELAIALWTRDAVTFAVMNLHPRRNDGEQRPGDEVASWVEAAEAEHSEVHQAIGMVMVQLRVDPEEALDRMRARAFVQGRTVTEVARDVVARRLRLRTDAEGGQGDRKGRGDTGDDGLDGDPS
ncbi:GAF and ANTAR domain-containing protein [Streptomyces cylindrosporus]|uniref:GAF and ANTAR domain-containing protein n=1 Tax=Streptomyces cylindrosporus TaxID=2927583 RepID=A0ABS9YII0_9ACTN|nr:GAF and ANTAR domain-containing protein [Streptomyces cylindrosporus]MCI3276749.1 GAF and ANTAR domain-containing protein [Streptomyces cylindrosporus]